MFRSIQRLTILACLALNVSGLGRPVAAEELMGSLVTAATDSFSLESSDYFFTLDDGFCPPECTECTAACQPLWTITGDALFLHRSAPTASTLIVNTADPTQNLNARSLRLGTQTGFDLSAIRQVGAEWALEGRYFGFDNWHGTATSTTTPGDLLQMNSAIPVFTFSGTAINGDLTSKLHNAELNGRWQRSDVVRWLAGFRYLELDDHLQMNLVNSAVPFVSDTRTRNRLYGCQAGGQVWL